MPAYKRVQIPPAPPTNNDKALIMPDIFGAFSILGLKCRKSVERIQRVDSKRILQMIRRQVRVRHSHLNQ